MEGMAKPRMAKLRAWKAIFGGALASLVSGGLCGGLGGTIGC